MGRSVGGSCAATGDVSHRACSATAAIGPIWPSTRGEVRDSPGFSTQAAANIVTEKLSKGRPARLAALHTVSRFSRKPDALETGAIQPSPTSPASSIALGPWAAMTIGIGSLILI